jgi:eukaryotic-like serine/threonine-protein kinase
MIGQLLGHYRVLEKIGSGGMGEVYRATDSRLGRDVAIKILQASLASDPDRLRRFEQEARAAAALNHPNIVAVYDVGMHEGSPYIVSELLEGHTLREHLLRGRLSRRQAADFGLQIANGLAAAHDKHIIHRDLKPENLFITRDGRMKILDFGIAKLTTPELNDERSLATLTTQTRSGSVLGTVAYMSPEQLRGKSVDHRSDIFSFGTVLYEMLAGQRAFSGETEVDTITAVLREDPPEIRLGGNDVPAAFDQIVRHCLEKEPDNRFQSARDLAFALKAVSDVPSGRHLTLLGWKSRLPRWASLLIAALAALAAGLLAGAILKPAHDAVYRRLTFERGTVYSARFSPDGRSVVYGASWNGQPLQLYSTLPDSLLARPLELQSAHLLALSRENELAIALHGVPGSGVDVVEGTLARAPLQGGAPRELLQDVRWADWSPNQELAVVHHENGRDAIEYPLGKVLYETNGWISSLRFSPEGNEIAFMDHPVRWDNGGFVAVTDLNGHRRSLTQEWAIEDGLAWSPKGDEIWFTASESGGAASALWAVTRSGHLRKVLSAPGGLRIQDIAADGRILTTSDTVRLAMEFTGKIQSDIKDLSWYDWTIAKDISADGQWVLFEEGGEPVGANDAIAIRKVDGSPPVRLGEGTAGSLSPDGKWAVAIPRGTASHLTLLPIGAGQPREIPLPGLEHLQSGTHFLRDGHRIIFNASQPDRPGRGFVVNESGGTPQPVTPEGVYAGIVSLDGKYLVGKTPEHQITLFPLNGDAPRAVPNADPKYEVAQWSSDNKAIYVYRPGEVPLPVHQLDVTTGKMKIVRTLVPADRAGVVSIAPVVTNPKASEFAYSYYQATSILYVISGLK